LEKRQIVHEAGRNCYGTMEKLFAAGGYKKILVSVGDHEIGGNPWSTGSSKTKSISYYRATFAEVFNINTTGDFRYQEHIGAVRSYPHGTDFELTSYAYYYKNVLFVTVDAFREFNSNIFNRDKGIGGEGVVTCTVDGDHLIWFENILREATKINSIKYVIVQAHIPIIHPVRTIVSSGQFMDYGEESPFWKTMVKYGVDAYLAGEVHANTVTKDTNSNLLQIASRGNMLSNFLQFNVTDDALIITGYNQFGSKARFNKKYVIHGSVIINKSLNNTVISSSGALKLLDTSLPLVHLDFEEILPLSGRQVIGMKHDDMKKILIASRISIRNVESTKVLPNAGGFGQQYDAQIANMELMGNSINGQYSGRFWHKSRVGIYSTGPHNGGDIISYALWFRTIQKRHMILIHYGDSFAPWGAKNMMFTVTLKNGFPILNSGPKNKIIPKISFNLSDGQWHHIAVSMPTRNCLLSEVVMYIDAEIVQTVMSEGSEDNKSLFFTTSGRVSLGGFGYSSVSYDTLFPHFMQFNGRMDEFYLWNKSIGQEDLKLSAKKNFTHYYGHKCKNFGGKSKRKWGVSSLECEKKCREDVHCWGFESKKGKKAFSCVYFNDPQNRPKLGRKSEGQTCGISI